VCVSDYKLATQQCGLATGNHNDKNGRLHWQCPNHAFGPARVRKLTGHGAIRARDCSPDCMGSRSVHGGHIQKGILLPKAGTGGAQLVDDLASSFASVLGHFYPLSGCLTASEITNGLVSPSLAITLCCNDKCTKFIHAMAPEVTISRVVLPAEQAAECGSTHGLHPCAGHVGQRARRCHIHCHVVAAQLWPHIWSRILALLKHLVRNKRGSCCRMCCML
jgi:hypothetical protein